MKNFGNYSNKLMIIGGVLIFTGVVILLIVCCLSAELGALVIVTGTIICFFGFVVPNWEYPHSHVETLDDKIRKIVDEKIGEKK